MSDAGTATGMARPTSRMELGRRLLAVLDMIGNREKAAEISERSTDQLAKYVKGSAEPPFIPLARLCLATGTRIEWLASGELPQSTPIGPADAVSSHDLSATHLSIALEIADEKLARDRLWLPRPDYAELVVLILQRLQQGWAYNRIRALVDGTLERLAKGEGDDAGRSEDVGAAGARRVGAGKVSARGDGTER